MKDLKILNTLDNIKKETINEYGIFYDLDTTKNYGYKGCGSYVATIRFNKIWLLVIYSYENDQPISEAIEEGKHYCLNTDIEEKALKLMKNKKCFLVNTSCYQLFKHRNLLEVFRNA